MRKRGATAWCVVVGAGCVLGATGSSGAQTFVALQPLPGGDTLAAGYAIATMSGGVKRAVGVSDSTASVAGEAWYIDLTPGATAVTSIGFLPTTAPFSRAEAMSADGSVIVGTSNYSGVRPAGFRWTPAGSMVQIGPVGGTNGVARVHDCDSTGSVLVGESTTSTSTAALPHRWVVGGTGAPAQALSTARGQALGCSASGTIIVGQRQSDFVAVRWSAALPAGAVTETSLGVLSPGESIAYGVNAAGSVIIGSSTSAAMGGDTEAFIHTGAMHGLRALPSATTQSSEALAVSDDGRVVVGTSRTGGDFIDSVQEAFVWTRRDGMRALSAVIGGAPFGFRLETALGISGDGTVITGAAVVEGSNPVQRVAYVVSIPAYCPADFNGAGGVTVQDVFDFLTAWFGGDLRADITQDFSLSVQDVFDFLTLWFAGCA